METNCNFKIKNKKSSLTDHCVHVSLLSTVCTWRLCETSSSREWLFMSLIQLHWYNSLGMCSPTVFISQSWLHHTSTKSLNFRHIPNACLHLMPFSYFASLVCWFCVSCFMDHSWLLLQVLGRKKGKNGQWPVVTLPSQRQKAFPKWPVPTKQISMHLSLAQSMSCDLLASKKTGYRVLNSSLC